MKNPVLLARIGAAHGIKGEVRVKPFGDPDALDGYRALYTSNGRTLKITRMRTSKSVLVVKFKGVNSRDEAEALNGVDLFVDRSALPDDIESDEFYIADLIGCEIINDAGTTVGSLANIVNFGAGDLLEIRPETGENWYLDFSKTNVPDIDLDNRRITIRQPEEVSERDAD